MSVLGIHTRLASSFQLQQPGKRTELLANICASFGAGQYVSPLGSAVYLLEESNLMDEKGIEVVFQNYEHPQYEQLFPSFLPYASVLDLIFNEGERSLEIIRSGRRTSYSERQVSDQMQAKLQAS
jgi:hypothetical protein